MFCCIADEIHLLIDAYGRRTTLAANGTTVLTGSGIGIQVGFTGRYLDNETGMDYFRSRYYGPALGRFSQRDPWQHDTYLKPQAGGGYPDGQNLYAAYFVPNYDDSNGEAIACAALGASITVVGGVNATAGFCRDDCQNWAVVVEVQGRVGLGGGVNVGFNFPNDCLWDIGGTRVGTDQILGGNIGIGPVNLTIPGTEANGGGAAVRVHQGIPRPGFSVNGFRFSVTLTVAAGRYILASDLSHPCPCACKPSTSFFDWRNYVDWTSFHWSFPNWNP